LASIPKTFSKGQGKLINYGKKLIIIQAYTSIKLMINRLFTPQELDYLIEHLVKEEEALVWFWIGFRGEL
jgi:hypothetical protein